MNRNYWDFENRSAKQEKVAEYLDATGRYEGTPWITLVDAAGEALDAAIENDTSKTVRVLAVVTADIIEAEAAAEKS